MKINLKRDQFLEKLQLASHFTSNKLSASQALQNMLLKSEGGKLHIYSTNLSTYFHTKITIKEDYSFQILIDPKKIIEFLTFVAPGAITLEIKEKQITIISEKSKGNFPVSVAPDFPLPPEITEKSHKLDASFLIKNLPFLLFTASRDESRPVLTGINFLNSDNELLMVATDGFRLSLVKEKNAPDIPSMIIPAEFLDEVVKHLKDEKEVSFAYSDKEKLVKFGVGDDEFYSRLIEGEFPPFEKVLLTDSATQVSLDKAEFLRNVKLISIFARDFSNVVVCEFKKDGLHIKPKKEANEENSSFQEMEMKGEDQKVAFNFRYLLDLLNHIEDKNVNMEILRSDAPVAFKLAKNPSFLHIIMPVRIQE